MTLQRLTVFSLCIPAILSATAGQAEEPIRIGMIGLDTSHVIAFTRILNDPANPEHVPGAKVVAGFKGGSPDLESSWSRVEEYAATLQKDYGVEIGRAHV